MRLQLNTELSAPKSLGDDHRSREQRRLVAIRHGATGTLRRLNEIRERTVVVAAPLVVIGQPLDRDVSERLAGVALQRLRHAPVEARAPCRPHVRFHHLTDQIVGEPVGNRSVLFQQASTTYLPQRSKYLLLGERGESEQQRTRRHAPQHGRDAEHHLRRLGQRRDSLSHPLLDVPWDASFLPGDPTVQSQRLCVAHDVERNAFGAPYDLLPEQPAVLQQGPTRKLAVEQAVE
ncbi:MAG: hypothetical protein ACR2JY_08675 [Chloroflexota bacterium]